MKRTLTANGSRTKAVFVTAVFVTAALAVAASLSLVRAQGRKVKLELNVKPGMTVRTLTETTVKTLIGDLGDQAFRLQRVRIVTLDRVQEVSGVGIIGWLSRAEQVEGQVSFPLWAFGLIPRPGQTTFYRTNRQGQVLWPPGMPEVLGGAPQLVMSILLARIGPYFPLEEVGVGDSWTQEIPVPLRVSWGELTKPRRVTVRYRFANSITRDGKNVAQIDMNCAFPVALTVREPSTSKVIVGQISVEGQFLFDYVNSLFPQKTTKLRSNLTVEEERESWTGLAQQVRTLLEEVETVSTSEQATTGT